VIRINPALAASAVAALALQFAVIAQGPSAGPKVATANSLPDLLKNVEQVRAEDNKKFDDRKKEFDGTAEAQKAAKMKEATDSRDSLDKSSKKLQDQYSANELKITQLNNQLRDKAMGLGLTELFGLARQVSNDVSTILQQSLITTQFPVAQGQQARDEFLRAFSSSRTTPTAADLQRVWTEVAREMTASGQVAKYQATVVQPGGEPQKAEIIRVGPFTAISGGKFLSYLPTLRTFEVLPRQLPSRFMSIGNRFSAATSGYAEAVVDSARGVLTGLYVERPTFGERIKLGQEVGYVIITVGVLGAIAFIFQLIHLVLVRLSVSSQLKNLDRPSANNPLGRVLLAFKGDKTKIEDDADVAELRITEAVLKEVPKLERFQSFLRLAVAAGPLLGLIGTVWGMILTFQSINESGSSDPKLMATGIGQAMIATVLGLGIAIPLLFAGALLSTLSKSVVQVLDEQSAGMLAESIEKQHHA
jgi:biopolymer transport protein ExbB